MAEEDQDRVQTLLVMQNKQLTDTNKMLHAFLCALLLYKHGGSTVLEKDQVLAQFYKYNVTWTPVVEGSDDFLLKAERIT